MGKEVKIGLAVIGVLLCVFAGVLFFRLRREAPGTAQKKVAAARKNGKVKAEKSEKPDKKDPAKAETPGEDRSSRFAGKSARGTSGRGDADRRRPDADGDGAPTLEASRYRGGSSGRYEAPSAVGNPSGDGGNEEADQGAAGQDLAGHLGELSMPQDRFAQRSGNVAFSQDNQADEGTASDDTASEDQESTASDRYPDERYAENRQTQDRYARDLAADHTQHGEQSIADDATELSEPRERESDNGTMQVSPLDDDQTEVRPAADETDPRRWYEQDRFHQEALSGEEPDGDRSDHNRLGGDEPGRDDVEGERFARGRKMAPEAEEMADDAESRAGERLEERPARLRSETDSYVVEPNDNFWRISQKVYGTGAYFKALEEHNRRQYGDKRLINVGDTLSVPPLAMLRENYPDLCPKPRNTPANRETLLTSSSVRGPRGSRTYTVAEGDTLFDIARHELGKASRWAEIYQLNREQLGEDFNYLSPGMQLVLPERNQQTDPVASRPRRDGYQR